MARQPVIRLRGAAEHNLKQLDLDLPHGQLIAVTGVSGSGKSSLAFDTLFREGQRRYLETFSSVARQFLGKLHRPAVEELSGLSPAIALEQKTVAANPRSTVGTLTGIYDHLRLLMARLGVQHCVACGAPAENVSPETIVELVRARFARGPFLVLAPLVEDHRGARKELLARTAQAGIREFWIDGALTPAEPLPQLDESIRHTIHAVCARIEPETVDRLSASVDRALDLGKGVLYILADGRMERFATAATCAGCGVGLPKLGTRLFSFNSPFGACPACKGLGVGDFVDPDLLVKDPTKTLRGGALVPSTPNGYIVYSQVTIDVLDQVCRAHGFDVDTPWRDLGPEHKDVIFNGSTRLKVPFGKHPLENRLKWSGITAKPREEGYYKGLLPVITETLKRDRNKNILRFVRTVTCSQCNGQRLNPEALAVTLDGKNIADYAARPLSQLPQALTFLRGNPIADPVLAECEARVQVIEALGLGHLDAARGSDTLSGGEAHRLRLATLVDGGLRGVLYVLDEPSVGLHPRDRKRLSGLLTGLRDQGNTVLTVEHDEAGMRAADMLVELGPAAGVHGGQLGYAGSPAGLLQSTAESRTRAFLAGEETISVPAKRRKGNGNTLHLIGATANNLRDLELRLPLNTFLAVCGVSGAGKSTLADTILARALRRRLHGVSAAPGEHRELRGVEHIRKVIHIDQSPIGRTPRSNPATYTGLLVLVRNLFAALPEAREAGLRKGWFSMNVKGGRCEDCQGAGSKQIAMHGFADVEVECETCDGQRFSPEILAIRFRGYNMAQVLAMTVEEALEAFRDTGGPERILEAMAALGLGYLTLGQSATTLSGGEAQRVKLAAELGRPASGHVLYILDEPTTGLHPADIAVLLRALQSLVDSGHTVLVVEHNPHVLKCADFLVELGPGSGLEGGAITVQGTPETVAAAPDSSTGKALAPFLAGAVPAVPTLVDRPTPAETPIVLRGVRTHNLQAVDVTIPQNRLTVVTGVSGSGKSSLAFDTLFHEGRRCFAASLSNQARRMMTRGGDAVLEGAEGITPTIALSQKHGAANPRATTATRSGLAEILRLFYARVLGPTTDAGEPLTARHFSFNHHLGACPRCSGLGSRTICDPNKLVTHPSRSLFEGALDGTKTGRFYGERRGRYLAVLAAVEKARGLDLHRPVDQLDEQARTVAFHGTGDQIYPVTWHYRRGNRTGVHEWETVWEGFAGLVEEEYARKRGTERGKAMADVLSRVPCETCRGTRLKAPYRDMTIANHSLPAFYRLTVKQAAAIVKDWMNAEQPVLKAVSAGLGPSLLSRLADLEALGLDYLSLDRSLDTLSGGELMRLRLASQLDARLRGVTYVLDEPTAGLHASDTARLVQRLKALAAQGNTVVVVEHDTEVIGAADHVIELGPGAGKAGGRLICQGPPHELGSGSLTGAWLEGRRRMPEPAPYKPGPGITIEGAHANNLANIDITIPGGGLIAVTGISGCGKSSLVFDVLAASAATGGPVNCTAINGLDAYDEISASDQDPPGSGGGYLVTRLGIYDQIRAIFAKTPEAVTRGFRKTRFALGGKGGRCETCAGKGTVNISMDFLPDVQTICEICNGKRFDAETLACRYRGRTIAEVLEQSAEEAATLFADQPKIAQPLAMLSRLGLGYLSLGRVLSSLSGGEARRLKLATALLTGKNRRRLILLDEPTTGLHAEDVAHLLKLFNALVKDGHTLIVVEHHQAVIRHAHHIIDLGPGSGEEGGRIVFKGPPEDLARETGSQTGRCLSNPIAG
ncbi:MAG: excinuclease ABC subunit UvrA [Acidobacteriota bacterium]|nr:excinuclease ABC subunit UvrA [Acidobacteriota bacterium]